MILCIYSRRCYYCLQAPELSAYTQAYDAEGFFTGVRSRVTIHKPAAVVYQSLSTNLHHVFTPMTVLLRLLAV